MGNFNWNLGPDKAAEVSPNIVEPNTVEPNTVQPSTVQPSAEPQAMSRRELRNRRALESAAEPAAEQLTEFFQLAETTVEAAPSVTVPAVHVPSASAHPAAGSSRAVRSTGEGTPGARKAKVRKRSVRSGARRPAAPGRPPRKQSAPKQSGPKQSAPKQSGRKLGRRRPFFPKLFSIGTMLGIGAIMISTSLPANAFFNPSDAASTAKASSSNSQSMKVASTVTEPVVSRDPYTVSSLIEQLKLKYGNRNFSYTNDINGTIQWPFPVPVPISSGFGPRIAPCGGCSSVHEGIDFTPGRGVAIGSIADGVVSAVIASHAGLGNHVIVDHVINGQLVQSVYGHMLDGSMTVTVGEAVKVTQKLGEVGSTGESTGAHLHFEIHLNNVPVDPFAWLKANAN